MRYWQNLRGKKESVSMKSGLEGRNNSPPGHPARRSLGSVSMKSGLEGRNNLAGPIRAYAMEDVPSQ